MMMTRSRLVASRRKLLRLVPWVILTMIIFSTRCWAFVAGPLQRPRPTTVLLRFPAHYLSLKNDVDIVIGPATESHVIMARQILLRNAMNPLSLSSQTLLVATTTNKNNYTDTANNTNELIGFGQIRPIAGSDASVFELASLYVMPDYRRKGIGKGLVQALLARHDTTDDPQQTSILCLLTLRPTASFYEAFGFVIVNDDKTGPKSLDDRSTSLSQLPFSIQLEHAAGKALSFILGNDLVCMVRQ